MADLAPNQDIERGLQMQLLQDLDARNARTIRMRHTLAQIEDMVMAKVIEELRSGMLNAYDAATCLSKITNSIVASERLRLDIHDRILNTGVPQVIVNEVEKESEDRILSNRETSRFAERLLTELYKHKPPV